MEVVFVLVGLVIGAAAGWLVAIVRLAKDPNLHRLSDQEIKSGVVMQKMQPDEALVKKPQEGLMLVAVPPDLARKLVNTKSMSQTEMRQLLWNQ